MSDMIDRRAAIDTLEEGFKDVTKGVEKLSPTYGLIEAVTGIYKCLIGKLPSTQPTFDARDTQYNLPIGTDCISRQDAIDVLKNRWLKTRNYEGIGEDIAEECEIYLRAMPSAQPRGKWIYHIDDLFPAESTKECDQCHAEQPLICDDEFCPHCGAKMEVTDG